MKMPKKLGMWGKKSLGLGLAALAALVVAFHLAYASEF